MQIEVLLFAGLREPLGRDRALVTLAAGAQVSALRLALAKQHPALAAGLAAARIAIDRRYASDQDPITPGAEVALIPPVSGG